ncbi:acyl carrier protein [Burkholderia glumae]|uniref:Acyl carrier protein n=1 Tax=Burkholderia glumae TaxID=337 RepID=A0AAP9Y3M5_BURGL|nr:acyl carrier protein [Burkholderia glumae]ACR28838.1 phosphopantetheine-containing protein [Burkholderia glumae BGR1]AJY67762.1 phosphopantetheine attachment site family protein [Burkholderia glumae LMG 2196 = ATCC 33617]KHJ64353.1 acyl carrier protein [Burkholderia glumae]MCM2483279.1 acyl carrier protein [Burkholderia glumae]MCM2506596.1 acyl carrier protein [Burkholderia glumae]
MTNTIDITETIQATCRELLKLPDLAPGEDFFDRGVSSLTVVELQLRIEEQLSLQVATSKLMAAPSIDGWANAYRDAASAA